ncbi:MAG: glycosyltransferase [Alistipes sp.]|nr:glycosyltransferase [Alistipes sp.]
MSTLLQINITANWGSTGKIAEQIGMCAMRHGWDSYIAYGRSVNPSKSNLIKVGSKLGVYWHVLESRLFDNHGLASRCATHKLIKQIKKIQPDIIHLHNIHGYYINYKILFEYLNSIDTPVVWTLHDCWTFTGHCSHFIETGCYKWQKECYDCAYHHVYPKSLSDRSRYNFRIKKRLFTAKSNCCLVPVSKWVLGLTHDSFLRGMRSHLIYNGIDTKIFSPRHTDHIRKKYELYDKFTIIAAATLWSESKGLYDFTKLRAKLPDDYSIILVGLSESQIESLPEGIIGITRTKSQEELAELYSAADVVLSMSHAETCGLTLIEGMACGTPAITYSAGGTDEVITGETGFLVKFGDIEGVANAIYTIKTNGKSFYTDACRKRAEEYFDKNKCFEEYITLYNELLNKTK